MKLSDFDYDLPKELIAQYPLQERDQARLLILNRRQEKIEHLLFKDITGYLKQDDLLVLNDTKVLPCRLIGKRLTGGKVEALLLKRKHDLTFEALIRPARIKFKERIIFNNGGISGELTAKNEITFSASDTEAIYKLGRIPLPPYIKRDPEDLDSIYYQTVYAEREGSIASPTAGLHFTKELIARINSQGVNIAYITLHISYSTFKPVKAEDVVSHKMEKEHYRIDEKVESLIKDTRKNKRRIIAVGTTSLRALESYALNQKKEDGTDLFIYPGYKFGITDSLLTNFHLPRTTLFMLVCAFAGEALAKKAYQEAIDRKYRFYSYGDAMLII
jgi:S-adenosylmethionine:tRNA ribosyltransferase-isomerase